MKNEIELTLKNHGIAPTPVRILVYQSLCQANSPMSLSDLEILLETIDKSTISRTLSLFRSNNLVHTINDGSGSVKYEVCKSHGMDSDNDRHIHFRCEKCGVTRCFNQISIPEVSLPEGFTVKEVSFVITGICSNCSR